MIAIALRVPPEELDTVTAELWDAGTAGITEDGERLTAFFEDDNSGAALLARFSLWEPEVHQQEERDWVAESLAAWQPFAVGERFWLVPEWREEAPPPGRLRLTTHPGMACGTGSAPATQLCLCSMEKWLPAGAVVADIGTGTGILADAARLLGARTVIACDIDHDAARIAHRNVRDLAVVTGSVRSLRSGRFDAVVANLNSAALTAIAPDLIRVRRPQGVIIVSGFRTSDDDRVAAAFGSAPRDKRTDSDWSCLVF